VGHLMEAEETNWIPRLRHLIKHGEAAAFPPFDRFGFAEKVKGKRIAELLGAFADARARSLRELDEFQFAPSDLGREAGIRTWGPSRWARSSPRGLSTT
jgi:hypothetical protein